MGLNIAVAGKGGTGKTTTCALLIRRLIDLKKRSILALDADSNSNLNELLGVDVERTIGQIREDFKKLGAKLPSGMYKDQMVEMDIHQSLIEGSGFDLMVMGRGEGPGCYCAANTLFKRYMDQIQSHYEFVVMDNEAGMEHLSRRTTSEVDYLLIMTDPSPRGVMTAARIRDLALEMKLNAGDIWLVISRLDKDPDPRLVELIKDNDFDTYRTIYKDQQLYELELEGKNIFDLENGSISLKQAGNILKDMGISG